MTDAKQQDRTQMMQQQQQQAPRAQQMRDARKDARANASHEQQADAEDAWICRGRD